MKQLIIGKSVPVNDFHNGVIGGKQFKMNVRKPDQIYMPGKVEPHILFEKTAEIFPVETKMSRNFLQRNAVAVVFLHIEQNLL